MHAFAPGRWVVILLGSASVIALLAVAPTAASSSGTTERGSVLTAAQVGTASRVELVSSSGDGSPADGRGSVQPRWSPDGTRVAFVSDATNLVPDTRISGQNEVYVKNLASGQIEVVSATPEGIPSTSESFLADWSPDGSSVAFIAATPTNLVPSAEGVASVLIVKDLETGALRSFQTSDRRPVDAARFMWSPDGSWLAVESSSDLTSEGTSRVNVYLLNVGTGALKRVFRPTGPDVSPFSARPVWSPDGTKLAFMGEENRASNFGLTHTYVYDLASDTVMVASSASDGAPGNAGSLGPSCDLNVADRQTCQRLNWSPDSARILFTSRATNLVDAAVGDQGQLYVKNIGTGDLRLVSSAADGTPANAATFEIASWSPDGRQIAFGSLATNLGATDSEADSSIFLKNIDSGAISILGLRQDGLPFPDLPFWPIWSPDGESIAFTSGLGGVIGEFDQLFVKSLETGDLVLVSSAPDGSPGNGFASPSKVPVWRSDSSALLFESNSSNLTGAFGWQIYSGVLTSAPPPPPPGPNRAPVWVDAPAEGTRFEVLPGESTSFTLKARDPDGDSVIFTARAFTPGGQELTEFPTFLSCEVIAPTDEGKTLRCTVGPADQGVAVIHFDAIDPRGLAAGVRKYVVGISAYEYVALGDSYSSGEGTFDYDSNAEAQACHRGPLAWPRVIEVRVFEISRIEHKACSGAKTFDLLRRYKRNPAQVPASPQPNVDLVTFTIGGNDVDFSDIVLDCYLPRRTCADDPDSKGFNRKLDRLKDDLDSRIYPAIERAYPNARIVHVGYPRITPLPGVVPYRCGWLGNDEQQAGVRLVAKLNATIAAARASHPRVEFVDVTDALDGHELCTPDSWMVDISTLPFVGGSERGHPNVRGQVAYGEAVANRLGFNFLPEF